MKRLRIERWSGQLLSSRTHPCCLRSLPQPQCLASTSSRRQIWGSSSASDKGDDVIYEDGAIPPARQTITNKPNCPPPSAALESAKLAALHARLALPKKLSLQTMARTLVDPSADADKKYNNLALAQLGGSLISYYVSEYLICTYPRLPITVLFAAAYAYNGPKTLKLIATEWGVESAAAPGVEVDPGLLQFSKMKPGTVLRTDVGSIRSDKPFMRRGISSRMVYDDEFGDTIPKETDETLPLPSENAYSNFVKAVVGSIYLHCGREAAKRFVKQHILSRHLNISQLFLFKEPVKELSKLCAREDFEYPVARMLSETGRLSRSPVFVVGIYSGKDKLGEGAGASLPEARIRASANALKAWYLYSPGPNTRVPSEMEEKGAREWQPAYIDIGEIVAD